MFSKYISLMALVAVDIATAESALEEQFINEATAAGLEFGSHREMKAAFEEWNAEGRELGHRKPKVDKCPNLDANGDQLGWHKGAGECVTCNGSCTGCTDTGEDFYPDNDSHTPEGYWHHHTYH